MKKSILLSLLITICYFGYAQYPLPQSIGADSALVTSKGGLKGRLVVWSFTDTTAANLQRIKDYDGALIKTTTPINALWYRVLDSAKWVQILPTGGGTGGIRAWLDGGNYNVLADGQGNAVFGTLGKNGIKFTTQAIPRFILDSAGILSETGSTIGIGYDPSNGNRLTQYSGGGSGNYLDSFWRVPGIDSNYYRINGVTYAVLDSTGGGFSGWSLTGNSGTDPSTNFLGTTDAQDLVIKTNGIVIGRFSGDGNNKISFGNGISNGAYSFSGPYGIASGEGSFAGSYGTASGDYSTAFSGATARGYNSTSFNNGLSTGTFSFSASGGIASGATSTALGNNVKSKSASGTVVGSYNDSTDAANPTAYDPLNRAFQIGIGTDNANRANALTVLFNGNTGIGTTTPDSLLDVRGGVKLPNLYSSTNATDSMMVVNSTGGVGYRSIPSGGGGTPSLTQYRLAVGDASNLLSSNAAITGGRALASDANGVPVASSTTDTELGYVNGVTSSIQTQLNAKLSNITGLVTAGTNVTVTGAGTGPSPYVVGLSGIIPIANGGTGYSTYDTTALASFGGGSGAAGDTAVFSTSAIYGSFFNSGYDTLYITRIQVGLQGTSPSVAVKVWYNDSLNVEAGGTALVTAGNTCTDTYTGTSITTFDNYKIPPGVWVWVKTSTVTTKPTYFSLTLIGYKKRV